MSAIRGLRTTTGRAMFTAASAPISAEPSSVPACRIVCPARMSSPAKRTSFPGADLLVDDHRAVLHLGELLAHDGVGALGHDRPRRHADRHPVLDRHLRKRSRPRLADDLQCDGRVVGVGGDHREAVHRRGVKRRQVVRCDGILREDAAERVGERDLLSLQARDVLEHEPPGLSDRDSLRVAPHTRATVSKRAPVQAPSAPRRGEQERDELVELRRAHPRAEVLRHRDEVRGISGGVGIDDLRPQRGPLIFARSAAAV